MSSSDSANYLTMSDWSERARRVSKTSGSKKYSEAVIGGNNPFTVLLIASILSIVKGPNILIGKFMLTGTSM